jgi:hypothetical protein
MSEVGYFIKKRLTDQAQKAHWPGLWREPNGEGYHGRTHKRIRDSIAQRESRGLGGAQLTLEKFSLETHLYAGLHNNHLNTSKGRAPSDPRTSH